MEDIFKRRGLVMPEGVKKLLYGEEKPEPEKKPVGAGAENNEQESPVEEGNAKQGVIDKVLNKIDTWLSAIDAKFERVYSELRRLEDKQDTKFTMVMWALSILISLILALKFIH